jgi:hypothetical protein
LELRAAAERDLRVLPTRGRAIAMLGDAVRPLSRPGPLTIHGRMPIDGTRSSSQKIRASVARRSRRSSSPRSKPTTSTPSAASTAQVQAPDAPGRTGDEPSFAAHAST